MIKIIFFHKKFSGESKKECLMGFLVRQNLGSKSSKTKPLSSILMTISKDSKRNIHGIHLSLRKLYITESSLTNITQVSRRLFLIIGYLNGAVMLVTLLQESWTAIKIRLKNKMKKTKWLKKNNKNNNNNEEIE